MQLLLNCHLAAFLIKSQTVQKVAKWQFNNSCMCICYSFIIAIASYK